MDGSGTAKTADDGARVALAWLGHPGTVLALIVLVVNDHLLKAAFPGWITGKLSDVAGLVVAPPLLAAVGTLLVPRLPARGTAVAALAGVAAGFIAVKTSGYAAMVASAAWSVVSGPSLVRADNTDLLALPALVLAGRVWHRARRDPVGGRSVRLVRLLVVLPAAVLAVAATSPIPYPDAGRVAVVEGRLAAGTGYGPGAGGRGPSAWQISDNAGGGWRQATEGESGRLADDPPEPGTMSCSAAVPQHCYRPLTGRIGVQQSEDAGRTWRTGWAVTEEQRAILSRLYPAAGARLATQEVVVLDVSGGGYVVLAANGRDGFVVRRVNGTWERIGFVGAPAQSDPFDGQPPRLGVSSPADRPDDVFRVVALLALVGALALVTVALRAGRRTGLVGGLPVALYGGLALDALLLSCAWAMPTDELLLRPSVGLTVLIAVTVALVALGRVARADSGWLVFEALMAAGLTMILTALPLVGWLYGRPAHSATAVLLALVATLPGLALAVRAGRLVVRPDRADPPWPDPVRPA
ncbi:hypothetical protein V6U90_20045 [Micromonospora sp. CPCC 206060]|uniref:hypothetical protein n=1 Tax=Micromonospora sp. CPCC 206060 TaxID=3122406 RepID=UPI002FF014F9